MSDVSTDAVMGAFWVMFGSPSPPSARHAFAALGYRYPRKGQGPSKGRAQHHARVSEVQFVLLRTVEVWHVA